eukprot:GHVO01049934.1.p1 GENE.GHVO01049934.1~~GHVO01049934.1.p1  ORF type:complete len:671 (-),score=118.73 GHVO01049934.1:141-2153(-)
MKSRHRLGRVGVSRHRMTRGGGGKQTPSGMRCGFLGTDEMEGTAFPSPPHPTYDTPSAWMRGLPPDERYPWFVDCYRMHVNDLVVWAGGERRGTYAPDWTPLSVVTHFWIFCKLSVERKAIHRQWNWERVLEIACTALQHHFEKADAKKKYGDENVFAPEYYKGRSLRFTALAIYNTSLEQGIGKESKYYKPGRIPNDDDYWIADTGRFDDVGGKRVWFELYEACQKWAIWIAKMDVESCLRRVSFLEWAEGLSNSMRHIWLVDCYRLKIHDLATCPDKKLSGIHAKNWTPLSVVTDFWIFCKMAYQRSAIPMDEWEWKRVTDEASTALEHSFNGTDAESKHGCGNESGVSSLRFTATGIIGATNQTACSSIRAPDINYTRAEYIDKFCAAEAEGFVNYWATDVERFDDVGSAGIWFELYEKCQGWSSWKHHLARHNKFREADPCGWSYGLGKEEMYQWFVDCFLMRAFDALKNSQGIGKGIWRRGCTPLTIVTDFWIFCKLASKRKAVPKLDWSWGDLVVVACRSNNTHPSETKYGGGNYEDAMVDKGRCLRFTADKIYDRTSEEGAGPDEVALLHVSSLPETDYWSPTSDRFEAFGGREAWMCYWMTGGILWSGMADTTAMDPSAYRQHIHQRTETRAEKCERFQTVFEDFFKKVMTMSQSTSQASTK